MRTQEIINSSENLGIHVLKEIENTIVDINRGNDGAYRTGYSEWEKQQEQISYRLRILPRDLQIRHCRLRQTELAWVFSVGSFLATSKQIFLFYFIEFWPLGDKENRKNKDIFIFEV